MKMIANHRHSSAGDIHKIYSSIHKKKVLLHLNSFSEGITARRVINLKTEIEL